jgi:hypothetical protein
MAKVPPRKDSGNRRNAGKRRRDGDLFGELCALVRAFELARGDDEELRRDALGAFLEKLSPDQRTTVIRDWVKCPRGTQKQLHQEIIDAVGGIGGPAEQLFRELREELNSRLDRLPEPAPELPPNGQPTAEELAAKFMAGGVPEDDARAMAADLSRSDDEFMREFWGKNGLPPEAVEEAVAEHRRHRKWRAVADDQLGEKLAADEERRLDVVRPHVKEAARLAKALPDQMVRLVWCLDRIDPRLRVSSEAAQEAMTAIRLEASEGSFPDLLAAVAEMVKAVATEMQTIEQGLARPKGGQKSDLARRAAEKHRSRGLTHEQIAEVLAFDKIVPENYTADNVRDLLRKTGKGRG